MSELSSAGRVEIEQAEGGQQSRELDRRNRVVDVLAETVGNKAFDSAVPGASSPHPGLEGQLEGQVSKDGPWRQLKPPGRKPRGPSCED